MRDVKTQLSLIVPVGHTSALNALEVSARAGNTFLQGLKTSKKIRDTRSERDGTCSQYQKHYMWEGNQISHILFLGLSIPVPTTRPPFLIYLHQGETIKKSGLRCEIKYTFIS